MKPHLKTQSQSPHQSGENFGNPYDQRMSDRPVHNTERSANIHSTLLQNRGEMSSGRQGRWKSNFRNLFHNGQRRHQCLPVFLPQKFSDKVQSRSRVKTQIDQSVVTICRVASK